MAHQRDEPVIINYNTEFKTDVRSMSGSLGASDHDPLIVDESHGRRGGIPRSVPSTRAPWRVVMIGAAFAMRTRGILVPAYTDDRVRAVLGCGRRGQRRSAPPRGQRG